MIVLMVMLVANGVIIFGVLIAISSLNQENVSLNINNRIIVAISLVGVVLLGLINFIFSYILDGNYLLEKLPFHVQILVDTWVLCRWLFIGMAVVGLVTVKELIGLPSTTDQR